MEQNKADKYKFYGTLVTAVAAIVTSVLGWHDSRGKTEASKEKDRKGYEVLVYQVEMAKQERDKLEATVHILEGRVVALENQKIFTSVPEDLSSSFKTFNIDNDSIPDVELNMTPTGIPTDAPPPPPVESSANLPTWESL